MRTSRLFALVTLAVLITTTAAAQGTITTPKQQFGHAIGDDYFLANYKQLWDYWHQLAKESDRIKLETIGKTEEGRDILMAIVTSPENHEKLARYKEISGRLARAEGVTEEEARALSKEGKAVVWIDGGLHASEVLVAQQLIEMVYQMCALDDDETMRFLDDVVTLFVNPNPDGQDLVADWYMRHEDPKKRSSRGLPILYQKYTGHDNNRDFFMVTQKESEAVCRMFYHEWYPQIVFNHHQTGPSGTVLFAPPFRGPFNHNFDPLVIMGIDVVGAAIHQRFIVEGKAGSTMRSGASYSTWWNGGLRTNVYFHNMIGLLTETIGHPTPMEIPLRLSRQLSTNDMPMPIAPQKWHFRQSVEYSISSNRAVLDVASRNREHFLFNIWRMGMNSIERGSRDHWTHRPHQLAAAEKIEAEQREARRGAGRRGAGNRGEGSEAERIDIWNDVLRTKENRDPRAYIIPADQRDFLTATRFMQALHKNGIDIHRATESFELDGRTYPKDSWIVQCAQAFRPHILDMFEPQDHPDDFPYPGGPPKPPYDSAGWTLAFQMGVQFTRVLDGLEGPFEKVEGMPRPPRGGMTGEKDAAAWVLRCGTNDSFLAANRLLAAGADVRRATKTFEVGDEWRPPGTIIIPSSPKVVSVLNGLTARGLWFHGVGQMPEVETLRVLKPRLALWDRYGGSMASGWMRWLLEHFEFEYDLVFPKRLDAGDLHKDYDVIVFVSGAIPGMRASGRRRRGGRGPDPSTIPEQYRDRLGSITKEKTIPRLRDFLEAGGTIATIGSSTALAHHLDLPIADALVEKNADGTSSPLPREKFFVPGSILRARVSSTHPLAWGSDEHVDVYFRRSPVFRIRPEGRDTIRPVCWFDSDDSLRSGWAWGQHHLTDGIAMAEAKVGRGTLALFGPEITFRAQPHGTLKYLFNAIHCGPARSGYAARRSGKGVGEGN